MKIGEKIKFLREGKRMTLEDVAKYLNVGRATVFKYESGKITNIPSDKIEALAKLFHVSPAFLMGWDEEPPDVVTGLPQTKEAKILSRGIDRLPKEQREQALAMFQVMFSPQYADLFTKGEDDDT